MFLSQWWHHHSLCRYIPYRLNILGVNNCYQGLFNVQTSLSIWGKSTRSGTYSPFLSLYPQGWHPEFWRQMVEHKGEVRPRVVSLERATPSSKLTVKPLHLGQFSWRQWSSSLLWAVQRWLCCTKSEADSQASHWLSRSIWSSPSNKTLSFPIESALIAVKNSYTTPISSLF